MSYLLPDHSSCRIRFGSWHLLLRAIASGCHLGVHLGVPVGAVAIVCFVVVVMLVVVAVVSEVVITVSH